MVNRLIDQAPAQFIHPVQDDRPADPKHSGGADDGQHGEKFWHAPHQDTSKGAPCPGPAPRGEEQTRIIHFHDQCDGAIHPDGDHDADDGEGHRFHPEDALRDRGKGDGHNLG